MKLTDYQPLTGVRVNLVQSATGKFADAVGSSRGISTPEDLALLKHLRAITEIVITDGETARLEQYRIPLVCDLAVITRKGYIPMQSSSTKNYLEMLNVSLPEAISKLRGHGYQRILLEVGPGLLSGAWPNVTELCLSTTGFGEPNLAALHVEGTLTRLWREGETTFSVWTQIQELQL